MYTFLLLSILLFSIISLISLAVYGIIIYIKTYTHAQRCNCYVDEKASRRSRHTFHRPRGWHWQPWHLSRYGTHGHDTAPKLCCILPLTAWMPLDAVIHVPRWVRVIAVTSIAAVWLQFPFQSPCYQRHQQSNVYTSEIIESLPIERLWRLTQRILGQ